MSLLGEMIREEWRLHTQLFGGRRFGAFPLAVFALAAVGLSLLSDLGVGRGTVVGGLHVLVAFLGLQVGTIGLIGRDAMEAVFGELTLLVSSYRTLPISWRRLLATFVLKDLLYYSGLVVGPLAIADAVRAIVAGTSLGEVLLLWVTLAGAFALGVTVSLAAVAIGTRSRLALVAVIGLFAVAIFGTDIEFLAFTPAAFYGDPTLATGLRGATPLVVSGLVAVVLFEPVESGQRPASWVPALPVGYGVAGRTLREVARSGGSVWKVLFSLSVFGAVTGWLLVVVADAAGLEIAPGIAFGTLLGLGTFTTYAWVMQFDTPGEYRRYPLPARRLLGGKLLAFLALAVPSGLVVLGAASLWFRPQDLLVGVFVFPAVAVYVFGVSVLLAGLSPTALLFDVARFSLFGVGIAMVAVPLVVLALVAGRYPTIAPPLAVGIALLAGVVGIAVADRAGPRWRDRTRG
ncbi:hypothetical protein [Halorhabdus sp. CBA1104]|uniref:hypothetical protein n=1 Tax=Halorhabdus sp. CBA1104 TaxID=1380432 RepID=UPI001E5FEA61|nr:hypothetical protein [Halorhabdus sp. CBA1104]